MFIVAILGNVVGHLGMDAGFEPFVVVKMSILCLIVHRTVSRRVESGCGSLRSRPTIVVLRLIVYMTFLVMLSVHLELLELSI